MVAPILLLLLLLLLLVMPGLSRHPTCRSTKDKKF
jgi:hypothetical protein